MARVRGNVTPVLSFKIGAAAAVDLGSYLTAFEFTDGDGEALTFSDVASGYRPVAINATFALDLGTGTAFEFLRLNKGTTGVTWTFQFSSATTAVTNPKWTGTCTLPPEPLPAAEKGTDFATFEVTIQLDSYSSAIA